MNMNKQDQTPQPLTKAEEQELEKLFSEIFKDSFLEAPEEITPEVRRYDELRSKQLTYMQYWLEQQTKIERRLMLLN